VAWQPLGHYGQWGNQRLEIFHSPQPSVIPFLLPIEHGDGSAVAGPCHYAVRIKGRMFGVAHQSLSSSQRKSEAAKPVTLGTPLKVQSSISTYLAKPAPSTSAAERPSRGSLLQQF
jgi:hypothetical protein